MVSYHTSILGLMFKGYYPTNCQPWGMWPPYPNSYGRQHIDIFQQPVQAKVESENKVHSSIGQTINN